MLRASPPTSLPPGERVRERGKGWFHRLRTCPPGPRTSVPGENEQRKRYGGQAEQYGALPVQHILFQHLPEPHPVIGRAQRSTEPEVEQGPNQSSGHSSR